MKLQLLGIALLVGVGLALFVSLTIPSYVPVDIGAMTIFIICLFIAAIPTAVNRFIFFEKSGTGSKRFATVLLLAGIIQLVILLFIPDLPQIFSTITSPT
ncbi:MAG: hypothetical protein MPJ05_07615 [Nitrosopumilus sp.]|nr:hypothetical protein [Nitrosopumilus sp.]